MINSTTPYKLAEIIRDTWPNLYKEVPSKENETKVSSGISTNSINVLRKS